MYQWATWLADVLRDDPFVAARLVEEPGWQSRGRPASTGPFTPAGVLEHHTACMDPAGHNGRSCALGCRDGSSSLPGPISQLHVAARPRPTVTVLAAGRANHGNGSNVHTAVPWAGGKDWNAHAIGIEVCGPPAGPWNGELIELRARVTACLLRHWQVGVDRVHLHGRINTNKIDPSGPWHREPHLAQLATWSTAAWRDEVARYLTHHQEDDDMQTLIRQRFRGYWNEWLVGGTPTHLTPETRAHYVALGVPEVVCDPHPQAMRALLHVSGMTEADLTPSDGT